MPPVTLATFADIIRHGYRLHGTCSSWRVKRDIDLARCPPGRRYVGARFKCRACGGSVAISMSKIVISNDAPSPALHRWRKR